LPILEHAELGFVVNSQKAVLWVVLDCCQILHQVCREQRNCAKDQESSLQISEFCAQAQNVTLAMELMKDWILPIIGEEVLPNYWANEKFSFGFSD
jgi:hypothetical protein